MYWIYFFSGVAALIAAMFFIGPKRAIDPRRLITWYLVVFALTYLVRPIPAEIHDRSEVYDVLSITGFTAVPVQMTVAVMASLLFLGLGYRLAGRRLPAGPGPKRTSSSKKQLITIAVLMIAWGYASSLIFSSEGAVENLADRNYGVNTGTTAWLTESVQFASTGTTALYILTGNLTLSVVLAIPWFILKVSRGWSRIVLVGYFAALLCVSMVAWRQRWSFKSAAQAALIVVGVLFSIMVFLPAAGSIRASGGNFFDLSREELTATFLRNFDSAQVAQTSRDISGFESTVYMIENDQPPTLGMYYVYSYFIKPIPRTVWKTKPLPPDLAEWIAGVPEDIKFFGLAAGSIGGALFAWGWIGIPLEFLFTGWAFRRLEFRNVDRRPSPAALLAYAGFFSLLPQLGRDSLIHMISERWLFVYGIPCFLFWYFDKDRLRAPSARKLQAATMLPPARRLVGPL